MNIFTMIVIIVAIVMFNKSYMYRMKRGVRESRKTVNSLMRNFEQMETRIENLETIVIEKANEKQFDRL